MPILNLAAFVFFARLLTGQPGGGSPPLGLALAAPPGADSSAADSSNRVTPMRLERDGGAAAQRRATHSSAIPQPGGSEDSLRVPESAQVIPFDDVEGVLLLRASLHGTSGRDTAGAFVLDTGAGALVLDRSLAVVMGVADSTDTSATLVIAPRALARLELGTSQMDQVWPVLIGDAGVVREVTDRPVLGLLGQRPLASDALLVDYGLKRLVIIPAGASGGAVEATLEQRIAVSRNVFSSALSARAQPLPFRLAGDGKIVLRGTLNEPRPAAASDSLTLILDTGATKCALFEPTLAGHVEHMERWPSLRGLTAPTLFGRSPARIARLPELRIGAGATAVARTGVDAILMSGELGEALAGVIGEPVHGLLGYSFLRHYRVGIDYVREVLWLDARDGEADERRWEYSQPGLQIQRLGAAVLVAGVIEASPAARAGIVEGDELLSVNGLAAARATVVDLARALEGVPGTRVRLRLRHGGAERSLALVRRKLL